MYKNLTVNMYEDSKSRYCIVKLSPKAQHFSVYNIAWRIEENTIVYRNGG